MKTLQTYLECGEGCATPANTMGMGNPGEIDPDTLSEPLYTAKSEVEKDKKKRKRKIKSLSESIFDKDIISKDICIGDVYELNEWTVPGKNEFRDVDIVNGTYFLSDVVYELDKNSWYKFLKPIKSFKHKITLDVLTHRYIYSPALYALTWIVLSCSSAEEIKKKTELFLKNVSAKLVKRMQHPLNADLMGRIVYRTETHILNNVGNQKDDMRMIVFKFFTFDRESDVIVCMTLKKRDL